MFNIEAFFSEELIKIADQSQTRIRRCVVPQSATSPDFVRIMVDDRLMTAFCSNDYLGLAHHPQLTEAAKQGAEKWGVGAGAAPMVSGFHPESLLLEQELAAFVGMPRAIYSYAGYALNSGIVPALVGVGDAVFVDKLSHACLMDGALLSRARLFTYPTCHLERLEALLKASPHHRKLVISDAIFSMDGTTAPILELVALCERYNALLLLDDAHGFGTKGRQGRGSLSEAGLREGGIPNHVLYMATLGKAAGCAGAFVAGSSVLIEWLLQKMRPYLFATAAPTMLSTVLRKSLSVIEASDARRDKLNANIQYLGEGLVPICEKNRWQFMPLNTAILPIIIGDNGAAMCLMRSLEAHGFWVPAIRPPTVPEHTARLRITLSSSHEQADLDSLLNALNNC